MTNSKLLASSLSRGHPVRSTATTRLSFFQQQQHQEHRRRRRRRRELPGLVRVQEDGAVPLRLRLEVGRQRRGQLQL